MVEAGGVSYSRDGVAMALHYVLPHSQREDQLNDGHLICGQNHLLADAVEVGHWVWLYNNMYGKVKVRKYLTTHVVMI